MASRRGRTSRLSSAAGAAAGCAVLGAVLAACSSAPSASGVSQQASGARAAVLPAAEQVRAQLVNAGVGWTAAIIGNFEACGEDDPLATHRGTGMLQYTASELMTPFSHGVPFATFARQVVAALNAAGWSPHERTPAQAGTYEYSGSHGGLDLYLVEVYDQQSLGSTATVDVSGGCFDAGSAANSYIGPGPRDDIREPQPTTTPTPRYS
jgi:hypothetical protein